MDSGIESVAEVDNADKQLVKSIKSLLCEIRRPFPESGIEKISYTVYLTDPLTSLFSMLATHIVVFPSVEPTMKP